MYKKLNLLEQSSFWALIWKKNTSKPKKIGKNDQNYFTMAIVHTFPSINWRKFNRELHFSSGVFRKLQKMSISWWKECFIKNLIEFLFSMKIFYQVSQICEIPVYATDVKFFFLFLTFKIF